MNKSDSIAALAAALAKAQGQIKGAIKDSANPFFKSKYADLASVVEAIREAFATNGLSYVQRVEPSEREEVRVETVILHASGEWLSCGFLAVPVSKGDAQGFGSALTYARRYSLSAAAGVAPEDDDGNAAAKAAPPQTPDPAGKKKLEACASLSSLQTAWESLTAAQRLTLNEVKDACKTKIAAIERAAHKEAA